MFIGRGVVGPMPALPTVAPEPDFAVALLGVFAEKETREETHAKTPWRAQPPSPSK